MNSITRVLFALLCAVLLACGGGGGPKTDDGLGGVGPFSSLRMEVRLESTNAIIDPTNIFVGERVKFSVTAIDGGVVGNPRITLNVNNWSMSGAPGGTLASNGTYTGSAVASPSTGVATATADGLTFTTGVRVVQPQAVISGRIRLTTGQGVSKLQIQAIDCMHFGSSSIILFSSQWKMDNIWASLKIMLFISAKIMKKVIKS